MSYSASISRSPIARRTFPVLAVCLHALVLWLLLWNRFVHLEPPSLPPSMEVSLVFAPTPEPPSPADPVVPEPTPEPIPEPPKLPEPVPEPIPEPPKLPEPAPVVIPDPVVIPTPVKVPPPPPVVVKPLPPTVKLPDPPKPTPKLPQPTKPIPKPPEPKKSRISTPEEIRQRNDYRPATARPRPVPVDPNKFKNSLLAAAESVRVNSSSRTTSPSASPASAAQERDYESAVTAAMRIHWSEDFNASDLSGPGRAALVRFVIRADGSIVSARIVRRSGVAAIDARAARAIQAVRSFPAPKDYGIRAATYDVEFELTAKD